MNATEIQTLDVARLIFGRVDVTLTRDNIDVTEDYNLHLEYLEEEGEICVKCY